jgi:transcriptional regulator with XRE-family HTH domain
MASTSPKNNKITLGNKLRKIRENEKLTQAEVASKAGVHVNYYARIERGEHNPSFAKLESILKALGINSIDIN